jgi:hypothetical protein
MNREELILKLGTQIAGDAALALDGWQHLVLASRIEGGTPDLAGFCYRDGRSTPVSPRDFGIFDTLEQLRDAMAAADGKDPWSACLIRIDRASGKVNLDFEYHDAERWAVTPKNVKQRAQEFAPH